LDISVGFTIKVKAVDFVGNWNESSGKYDGPFREAYDLAVSMLTAAWNALCKVAEAVKNAIEELASWIWGTITSLVTSALSIIGSCMENYAKGVAVAAADAWEEYKTNGSISTGKLDAVVNAIFTPFVNAILILVTVLTVVVRLAELATGVGAAITLIIPLIIGMVAISVDNPFTSLSNTGKAVEAFFEWMFDLTSFTVSEHISLVIAVAGAIIALGSWALIPSAAKSLVLSVLGLIIVWASGKCLAPTGDILLAVVGVAICGLGLFYAFTGALGLGADALASQGLVAALAILAGLISFIFGIGFLIYNVANANQPNSS